MLLINSWRKTLELECTSLSVNLVRSRRNKNSGSLCATKHSGTVGKVKKNIWERPIVSLPASYSSCSWCGPSASMASANPASRLRRTTLFPQQNGRNQRDKNVLPPRAAFLASAFVHPRRNRHSPPRRGTTTPGFRRNAQPPTPSTSTTILQKRK